MEAFAWKVLDTIGPVIQRYMDEYERTARAADPPPRAAAPAAPPLKLLTDSVIPLSVQDVFSRLQREGLQENDCTMLMAHGFDHMLCFADVILTEVLSFLKLGPAMTVHLISRDISNLIALPRNERLKFFSCETCLVNR